MHEFLIDVVAVAAATACVLAVAASPCDARLRKKPNGASDQDKVVRKAANEWSERDERHGRLRREGSGRAQRELPRYNGANGRATWPATPRG